MKTDFVPKLVTTVASCCVLYGVVTMTSSLLSVKAVASVGYIESLVSVVSDSLACVTFEQANRLQLVLFYSDQTPSDLEAGHRGMLPA